MYTNLTVALKATTVMFLQSPMFTLVVLHKGHSRRAPRPPMIQV
jgi:hypothetical protein